MHWTNPLHANIGMMLERAGAEVRAEAAEQQAIRAAHKGIPLACAGEIGFTMGGTRWLGVGGHWFYQGLQARLIHGDNVILIATPEEGMSDEVFAKLWRDVVRDLMRGAKCVRVRVCERTETDDV